MQCLCILLVSLILVAELSTGSEGFRYKQPSYRRRGQPSSARIVPLRGMVLSQERDVAPKKNSGGNHALEPTDGAAKGESNATSYSFVESILVNVCPVTF